MKFNTIVDRLKSLGLPVAKDSFEETKETPLPDLPYAIYSILQKDRKGSDDGAVSVDTIQVSIELYTDKADDISLIESNIEDKVLNDIEFSKISGAIENEEIIQTVYEFTIYEKVKGKEKNHG